MKINEYIKTKTIPLNEDRVSEEEVMDWLKDNPFPDDATLHKWAEDQGVDVHQVEAIMYGFATKYMKFWTGGLANKMGFTEEDADPKQLKMGIEVEAEHVDDEEMQKRIALDHLQESKFYYTKLKEMEKEI